MSFSIGSSGTQLPTTVSQNNADSEVKNSQKAHKHHHHKKTESQSQEMTTSTNSSSIFSDN